MLGNLTPALFALDSEFVSENYSFITFEGHTLFFFSFAYFAKKLFSPMKLLPLFEFHFDALHSSLVDTEFDASSETSQVYLDSVFGLRGFTGSLTRALYFLF